MRLTGTVGVAIATTEGPSEVLRIALEAPEVRSVVCLNMSTEALSISPAYDAFIRRPTGVVERELGHPAYRADVSATIDSGNSWQLGLYLAHRLMAEGRLAALSDAPEHWIWVTGTLDSNLAVGPVSGVERKLARSADWFAVRSAEDRPVSIIAPEDAADILAQTELPSGILRLPIARIETALDHLGLDSPVIENAASKGSEASSAPPRTNPSSARRSTITALLVVALALLGIGFAVRVVDPSLFDRAMASLATGEQDRADSATEAPPPAPLLPEVKAIEAGGATNPIAGAVVAPVAVAPAETVVETIEAGTALPVEISWKIARPREGKRCRGDFQERAFVAENEAVTGTVCQVIASVVNQSASQASIVLVGGVLGRFRDYMREDRHVARETAVVQPGARMQVRLDVPKWVRGDIRIRAVVLVTGAGVEISPVIDQTSLLDLLQTPPPATESTGVEVSTIRLAGQR